MRRKAGKEWDEKIREERIREREEEEKRWEDEEKRRRGG
jgi:hypothetical protein